MYIFMFADIKKLVIYSSIYKELYTNYDVLNYPTFVNKYIHKKVGDNFFIKGL